MERTEKISPFIVMDIVKEAQKYPDAIHFEIGEPDLQATPEVFEALERAVKEKKLHYTESLGLITLREKVAEFYSRKYSVDVSPERILITCGTSGAFLIAYSILLNSGDRIALPDPGYPCYKNFAYLLDEEPVLIPVDRSTDYQITVEHLKGAGNIKAIQISSPSNPTGNVYDEKNLRELINYCNENGIFFISDEIYHGLVYDKRENTALEFSDDVIVINGFSKYFCLPGLRLGWMILPERLVRKAEVVMQNVFISAPTLSQYGALEAFNYEYLDKIAKTFKERRDFLYSELSEIFDIDVKPEGAFYIWANIERYSNNSYEFSKELLKEIHVAITPGIDFGKNRTEKYIRFAYTRDIEHMKEGVKRIKDYLKSRKNR